ncbi:MAG: hypothetical protein ACTHKM_00530, partial [Tsuneonella sp.]
LLVLRKQPAGCAARLLVETDRKVERLNDVGKIDAHAGVRLLAPDILREDVLAERHLQQQGVVFTWRPRASRGRPGGERRGRRNDALRRRDDRGGASEASETPEHVILPGEDLGA